MPHILLLFPTGWSVRNFARSDFLDTLVRQAEVTVVSTLADQDHFRAEMASKAAAFEPFPTPGQGTVENFIREFNKFSYFRHKDTVIARYFFDRSSLKGLPLKAKLYKYLLIDGSNLVGRFIPLSLLAATERRLWKMQYGLERERRLLKRLQPDLVISTMPLTHTLERPLLWAADDMGIPCACAVQSWDNLTTKGMFPVDFALCTVWSEHMRKVTLQEYPGLDPASVEATGAPQFDFCKNPDYLVSREAFCETIGADPARPLIVWAGVTPNLMPGEPDAVALLCEALRAGRLPGRPQLLLRPHPIGGGARFADVRSAYPELLFTESNDEDPHTLTRWSPTTQDIVMLVNTVAHADVNINMFSTMTLDSCIFDRPVVNIAFDEREPGQSSARLRRFYDFEYYQIVLETGAVRLAATLDELIRHTSVYLEDPALDRDNRARLVAIQCGTVDGQAARRTAEAMLRLVEGKGHRASARVVASP